MFTEDLKRLYVTMKEGFPLEYVVRSTSHLYTAMVSFSIISRELLDVISCYVG